MARRITIGWIVIVGLMLALNGLHAQSETWQAWLYNASNGEMTLIDGDGYIRDQIKLYLPLGYNFFPFDVIVSDTGARVAYVGSSSIHDEQQLFIHNIRTEVVQQYALPNMLADGLSLAPDKTDIFNDSDTALAFGFSLPEGGWQIHIIDMQTSLASSILRSGSPNVVDIPAEVGMTPVIRSFTSTEVIFTLVNVASNQGSPTEHGSYVWETQANGVALLPDYPGIDSDSFFPTGETVMVAEDDQFITRSSFGQNNALVVNDPTTRETMTFYATAELGFFEPRFIQNGERVLVRSYNEAGTTRNLVIGRDGKVQGEWLAPEGQVVDSIWGTSDGFVYTADTIDPAGGGSTTLYTVNAFLALDSGKALFTSSGGARARLVWLKDPRLWVAPHPRWQAYSTLVAAPTANPETSPPPETSRINQWQAWIYEDSGRAVKINQGGAFVDLVLFTPPSAAAGTPGYPAHISVSHDGSLLAGIFSEDGLPKYLTVYDAERDSAVMTYTMPHDDSTYIPPHTIDRAPQNSIFNEWDTALAFGFGLGENGWQITVLDIYRGEPLGTLRHDSPGMQNLGTVTGFGVVPVIQKYARDTVYFTIQPGGALEPPYDSFAWNVNTGEVSPNLIYANPQTDTFAPTGEVLMAMIDPRLTNTAHNFSYGQLNALHVYDPLTSTRYPFFNSVELWLFRPEFIQNGERVLAGGSDASGAFTGWVVLERDGRQVGVLPVSRPLWDAAGVGDGFVYLPRDDSTGTQLLELVYVNTRDGLDAGETVWSIARTGRPQIAWAGYTPEPVAYTSWAQIAPPVLVVGGSREVSAPSQLVVGGQATTRTIGGDALRMRTGPGADFDIATRLNTGTRVTLVDGPRRAADGTTWWKVRTPSGLEGWVVESAEGINTLVPD